MINGRLRWKRYLIRGKGTEKNGTPILDIIVDLQKEMEIIYDDIGKSIVTTVMENNRSDVKDLGVDVPTSKYIEVIKQYKPKAIGFSKIYYERRILWKRN
ncbi:hypothetical protein [Clostridium sp. AWRP]|uniref:hypothetical protein n=1 Tax=Clostridium sp. AWRP TaxID=2212991 RepID=UPI001FAA7071|nr:hypothetical protein [Clostridium sp. AWRP]